MLARSRSIRFVGRFAKRPENLTACASFVVSRSTPLTFASRAGLIRRVLRATWGINCPHTESEIFAFIETILSLPAGAPGVLVEAGCFKGGSTAKFSLAANICRRPLVVFDSFQGIPQHSEPASVNIFGRAADFPPGSWAGSLQEVRANVTRYGCIDACRFVPGWFEDTLPLFREPVAAAYLDVDLVSSTTTCLKYLWPLLQENGVVFSQDGHLPAVIEALSNESFWRDLGAEMPQIEGLGHRKLLRIQKLTRRARLGGERANSPD